MERNGIYSRNAQVLAFLVEGDAGRMKKWRILQLGHWDFDSAMLWYTSSYPPQ